MKACLRYKNVLKCADLGQKLNGCGSVAVRGLLHTATVGLAWPPGLLLDLLCQIHAVLTCHACGLCFPCALAEYLMAAAAPTPAQCWEAFKQGVTSLFKQVGTEPIVCVARRRGA